MEASNFCKAEMFPMSSTVYITNVYKEESIKWKFIYYLPIKLTRKKSIRVAKYRCRTIASHTGPDIYELF